MRTINCINTKHLGDCIQTLHFLINAAEKNNVVFNFVCNPTYQNQLQDLLINHKDKIKLTTYINPAEEYIETWVAGYGDYGIINDQCIDEQGFTDQSKGFLIHWKRVSDIMKIDCPFLNKEDLIYNQIILLEDKIKNKYDYLFINSTPLSLEYKNFEEEEQYIIQKIKKLGKTIITSKKIKDIPCTLDFNLSVVNIGQLSKNVKNIIGVNTGPIHLCMNKWSLPTLERFIVWSPSHNFNFGSNFKTVKSLYELNESEL